MNPWRGLKDLPREVWLLSAATLVNRAGTMVLPFLVLYLTRTLGITPAHAALSLTVYGIAALITMPVAGRLTDIVGPIAVIKTSLFLSGVLLFLYPLAHSFPTILAITFLFAILNESVRPPSLSMISDLVRPPQRKSAFALSRLAVNLGMSVGPAIGGVLALISFRWLFFVDGATSILAGVVIAMARWDALALKPSHDPDWSDPEELGREIEADSVVPLAAAHPARDLRAFRNPRMLYFLAAMIPAQLVFFQLTSSLPLFLVRNLRLPESLYGTVFTLNTLHDRRARGSAQHRHGALVASPYAHARRSTICNWFRLFRFRHPPCANFRSGRHLDLRRNDPPARKFRLCRRNRPARPPRRVHGPLHNVVQHRILARPNPRCRTPPAPGPAWSLGSSLRLRLHFSPDDEPHRKQKPESSPVATTTFSSSWALFSIQLVREVPDTDLIEYFNCDVHPGQNAL